jgi:hypothetical protein
LAGETEVLGENLPQCHFVYHKPYMLYPDANPGRRSGKPESNRLSYGTAKKPPEKYSDRNITLLKKYYGKKRLSL